MTCKYKVKIKDIQYNYKVQMTDIQSKYKFKVFCTGYDDSEIKDKIDAMYQAWPKVSGEGETITLNDTANTTMAIDLKGNTSQVVSGDNTINVNTKNLYDATKSETTYRNLTYSADNQYVYYNGIISQAANLNFKHIPLKKGTYTVTVELVSGSIISNSSQQRCLFYIYGSIQTAYFGVSDTHTTMSRTFTLNEDGEIYLHAYPRTNETFQNAKIAYQVVKGDTADYDFVPYQSQSYPINLGDIELENGDSIQKINNSWNIVRNNATIEPITDTTLIGQLEASKKAQSYSGQTNISQVNNDAPFTISATALMDLSNLGTSTVSTLNTASVNRLGTPVFNQSIDPVNLEINSEDLELNNEEETIEETPEER